MIDLAFLHNAVDEGDFTEEVCRSLLDVLAEVGQLREKVALQRRLADRRNENLVKLTEENERLQAELTAAGQQVAEEAVALLLAKKTADSLRAALPDAGMLKRAAEYAEIVYARRRMVTGPDDPAPTDARQLAVAAARIRAVQEAGGD